MSVNIMKISLAEHQSVISLSQRYIAKPDNRDVKTFAVKLVPQLEAELTAVKTASRNFNSANK